MQPPGYRPGGPTPALLLSILVALATGADATYWTATSWFAVSFSTDIIGTFTDVYTTEYVVKPTVTPTATVLSTSVEVMDFEDLTLVYAYIPYEALPASDMESFDAQLSTITQVNAQTVYVEPAVYTAPTTCKSPFTVSTNIVVNVPYEVTDQLKPTSTSVSVNSLNTNQLYTYVTMFLTANAVPTTVSGFDNFVYSDYILSCLNPTATGADFFGNGNGGSSSGGGSNNGGSSGGSNSGGSSGGSSLGDTEVCSLYTGCTTLRVWVIVVATLIPALFLLGWVESFLWFRRLMLGRSALRVGTICWICISLWMICFTRTAPARSPEDQAQLRRQWSDMGFGTRWRLWWKWGFRHSYPVDILGQPGMPGMAGGAAPPMENNMYTGGQQPPPPGAPGALGMVGPDGYMYWGQQKEQPIAGVQPYPQQYPGQPMPVPMYDPGSPPQPGITAQGGELDGRQVVYSEADSRPVPTPVYEAPADSITAEAPANPVTPAPSSTLSPATSMQSPTLGYVVSPVQSPPQHSIYEASNMATHHGQSSPQQ